MRHATILSILLIAPLAGCGRDEPAPVATPATVPAQSEAVSRVGDITIRATAMQTSALSPQVASQYGIARAPNTVMLLVAVRQGPEGQEVARPARITATATDLRGRTQDIVMRELQAGDMLDYIGTADVLAPDTLRFRLHIVQPGGAGSTMEFTRDFFPR